MRGEVKRVGVGGGGGYGYGPRQVSNIACLWLDFHWLTGQHPMSGIGGYTSNIFVWRISDSTLNF